MASAPRARSTSFGPTRASRRRPRARDRAGFVGRRELLRLRRRRRRRAVEARGRARRAAVNAVEHRLAVGVLGAGAFGLRAGLGDARAAVAAPERRRRRSGSGRRRLAGCARRGRFGRRGRRARRVRGSGSLRARRGRRVRGRALGRLGFTAAARKPGERERCKEDEGEDGQTLDGAHASAYVPRSGAESQHDRAPGRRMGSRAGNRRSPRPSAANLSRCNRCSAGRGRRPQAVGPATSGGPGTPSARNLSPRSTCRTRRDTAEAALPEMTRAPDSLPRDRSLLGRSLRVMSHRWARLAPMGAPPSTRTLRNCP
jgi:hypothetical protein